MTDELDAEIAQWLAERSTDHCADDVSVRGMRLQSELSNRVARERPTAPDRPARETALTVPGPDGPIPARLFHPDSATPLPTIVYFPGGGWVAGGPDTHAHQIRRLCVHARSVVLAINYRLAPEHRFPAGFDDCLAATRWAFAHPSELGGDPSRIAVAGDSAGGQLAASVAIACRDEGIPLAAAALIVPALDLRGGYQDAGIDTAYPSRIRNAEGYGLTTEAVAHYVQLYGVDPAAPDWRGSPFQAADLTNLAPTLLYTAGFDMLRDEGAAYAARLTAAGVRVRHGDLPTLNHGFSGLFGVSPVADAASRRMCRDVAEFLA